MINDAVTAVRNAVDAINDRSLGDRAVVRLRMSGTRTGAPLLGQPARGRQLAASAVFIYRVTGGRLAEAWQLVDGLAFYRLAGLID